MPKKIGFFQGFTRISPSQLHPMVGDWKVTQSILDIQTRTAQFTLEYQTNPELTQEVVATVQQAITQGYQLNSCTLAFEQESLLEETAHQRTERLRQEALSQLPVVEATPQEGKKSNVIYGSSFKGDPILMSTLDMDLSTVIVEGDVFSISHDEKKKRNAWVIAFDISDQSNSVRVQKYIPSADCKGILSGVKEGMRVRVKGTVNQDRYYNDIVLTPQAIVAVDKEMRSDTAKMKRVELHMHTNMSALDALCSVNPQDSAFRNIVKRAEAWGHPAIALTDHGVVHSFPEAEHSAKEIKILYGTEAYFVNNLDDSLALNGDFSGSLHQEIVCFDIETTGLSNSKDKLTEIGAVILKDGEITKTFQTFLNPEQRLSYEITKLTGITDDMLKDAPSQEEGIRAFLDFIGDRVLAAHNAMFDMGFITEGCRRYDLPFLNACLDTLVLGQNFLTDLKKFTLDNIADRLSLPNFNHHRAVDDATVVAQALIKFIPMLEEQEVHDFADINSLMFQLRPTSPAIVNRRYSQHLIVIAKNKVGLRNLYQLVSLSHLEHFKRHPIMPKTLINQHREGLIIGSACEAGELFSAILRGVPKTELLRIASWYDYLEIQPLCNNEFLIRSGKATDKEELRQYNRTIIELGKELNIPVCATGDVHFLDPEDEIFRRIYMASKYKDSDEPLPLYLKTTDEMLEEFSYLGEEKAFEVVVKNTNLIADMCEKFDLFPKGLFSPKLENSEQELTELVWGKVEELYGENPPELVKKRVSVELNDIISCKYDVIYMSAQKLVKDSMDHGYLVGSRGSVGSSIVAYMSGITEVNSLPAHYRCPNCKYADFEYGVVHDFGTGADMPDQDCPQCGTAYEKDGFNIPFEIFLGFGGDKVPDIDLNFSGDYQGEAHRYTFELFGQTHVFKAGTVGTIADKSAYGFVKNYLDERHLTVSKSEINRLTMGCTGVKRSTGQHPGGMIVVPQDMEIYDFCPVQRPADDLNSDFITTHFDYHAMEDNLLKLDILGHRDPTMMFKMQQLSGVDVQKIPLDDKDTMSIFRSTEIFGFTNDPHLGNTGAVALPEFGTSLTRDMLEEIQPDQLNILVRISGFSHGTDVWSGNAQDLIRNGTATVLEAIGCRDDIMIYLISLGMDEKFAFKIMENVRKGKGLPEGAEEEMRTLNVPEWYIDSCKKIKYLFPKAHAAAYVMMAYRVAWFKVHMPLVFYAAYFTIRSKGFDENFMCRGMDICLKKIQNIKEKEKTFEASATEKDMLTTLLVCYEFYRRGFSFKPLDLYTSGATDFTVNEEEGCLIPPFTSVAGLGDSAAEMLVEQRQGTKFISIEDVAIACPKVSKTNIEKLTQAGAFGTMPASSQIDLFSLL